MLSRFALMVQAAVLDFQFFDLFSPFNDGRITPEVGVCGRHVAEALVVSAIVVMVQEGFNLAFEVPGNVVILPGVTMFVT
jgi:hypothetical protein